MELWTDLLTAWLRLELLTEPTKRMCTTQQCNANTSEGLGVLENIAVEFETVLLRAVELEAVQLN